MGFLATLENITLKQKLLWRLFRLLMVKLGLLFISTSGYTGLVLVNFNEKNSCELFLHFMGAG